MGKRTMLYIVFFLLIIWMPEFHSILLQVNEALDQDEAVDETEVRLHFQIGDVIKETE